MTPLATQLLVLREESDYEVNGTVGRRPRLVIVYTLVLGALFGASLLLAVVGFGMWGGVVVLGVAALIVIVVAWIRLLVRVRFHSPLPVPTHADQV